MTTVFAPRTEPQALYPPTVVAPPRPLPLRRFLLTFVRNPLSSLPRPVYEEPIVFHDNGRGGIAWVTDPALVEQVLLHGNAQFPKSPLERRVFAHTLGEGILTSEGASWRWQRRTAAPLFRPADLSGLVPIMTKAAEDQVARWRTSDPGTVHAIDRDMTETTFHVISATMFAGSADAEAAAILKSADTALATISWDIAAAMLRLPAWMWYPGKFKRRRAARTLRAAVAAILARRRATGLEGDDLLARLARAQDPETGEPMSEKQLIDNLVTFLAAGHETTAKALTWTLYLLARAPQWQERILAEIDAVVGKEAVSAEHLERLPVTRAVLKEAMRLYPPAPDHDAPRGAGHDAGPGDDQGRHAHRHSDLRGAPAQEAVGGPGPLRSRSASRPSARQSMRARSSCRSASGRAPASAAPSPSWREPRSSPRWCGARASNGTACMRPSRSAA